MRTSTKALLGATGSALIGITAVTINNSSLLWLWGAWAVLAIVTAVAVVRERQSV
ncbi:hypothetical protein [Streptomyces sp. NPDC020965]|uniref:hypothetical protein n=1 Tax=Streptomyces sp. NPDC020965 TaxID=3365105 RepID=UPI0037B5236D